MWAPVARGSRHGAVKKVIRELTGEPLDLPRGLGLEPVDGAVAEREKRDRGGAAIEAARQLAFTNGRSKNAFPQSLVGATQGPELACSPAGEHAFAKGDHGDKIGPITVK